MADEDKLIIGENVAVSYRTADILITSVGGLSINVQKMLYAEANEDGSLHVLLMLSPEVKAQLLTISKANE